MNRMTFIAPPKKPRAPRKPKASKVEMPVSKPLSGYLYVAMGYVPGAHNLHSRKSAVVGTRRGAQRKDRRLSITPMQYNDRESVIEALNAMIRQIEEIES